MPVYTYYCKKCNKYDDVIKSFSESSDPCYCEECKEEMNRDYSKVGIIADQGKNDPNSPMYWKRGKTNKQVSDVIAEESVNPY